MRGSKPLPDLVGRLLNSKDKTFDEFWEEEDKLWELSMQESFRQRNERLKKLKKEALMVDLCPWCMHEGQWIMVHGHYQCPNCCKNVTECCQGEIMESEK